MTSSLIAEIFAKHFRNPVLDQMEDAAVVPGAGQIALTTDSFVVTPLFFPGGDIGKMSVCGTVNDLLMRGAIPKYLTCGFILEEGADIDELDKIVASMARTAKQAKVTVVAGDTKVIGGNGGIYINTAGVGFVPQGRDIAAGNCRAGDVVLVSGNLGDHHAAILSARMNIKNEIESDCAPLNEMVQNLLDAGVCVRAMRDITRGGVATVLNEFARASSCCIEIDESAVPVSDVVRGFCGILGLDPFTMGNEGKMAVVVAAEDTDRALGILRDSEYGSVAAIVGNISHAQDGSVLLRTKIGGVRVLTELIGEGLSRIC